MDTGGEQFHFKFKVLGRYDSRLRGNEPHVTLNLLAGRKDHLVFCGTLTLSEPEWNALRERLQVALGDALEVDDHLLQGGLT